MAKSNSQVSTLDDDANDSAQASPTAPAAAAREIKGNNHDEQLSGKRRTITINPTEGDGGHDAVFVSLNGYAYQIPRGEPQSVPEELVEILKNAKSTIYQSTKDGVIERTVQRYSFTLE
jgi:hypothetical protein